MRNKASGLLKQIIAGLTAMARSKTMALKSKTKAIKTRLVIFSLLHQNRKLFFMTSFSDKLSALTGQQHHNNNNDHKNSKDQLLEEDAVVVCGGEEEQQQQLTQAPQGIVLYNSNNAMWVPSTPQTKYEDEEDDEQPEEKYPDQLSRSLSEVEVIEMEDPRASVIDMVKHSKEDKGEEFRLEDEIDRVADLFIKRFHRQMRMQKQISSPNNNPIRIASPIPFDKRTVM